MNNILLKMKKYLGIMKACNRNLNLIEKMIILLKSRFHKYQAKRPQKFNMNKFNNIKSQ